MREKLTKSDVEKIREEIEHRKLVERKELIEAVKEARSHGDLSENFEYHAIKNKWKMILTGRDKLFIINIEIVFCRSVRCEKCYDKRSGSPCGDVHNNRVAGTQ